MWNERRGERRCTLKGSGEQRAKNGRRDQARLDTTGLVATRERHAPARTRFRAGGSTCFAMSLRSWNPALTAAREASSGASRRPEPTSGLRITCRTGPAPVTRGGRGQHSDATGLAGLGFNPDMGLDLLNRLAFGQTVKRAMTGVPMGMAKDSLDPHDRSLAEMMRLCQTCMIRRPPRSAKCLASTSTLPAAARARRPGRDTTRRLARPGAAARRARSQATGSVGALP